MRKEFYCPLHRRTFIRTEEDREPSYLEYYESYLGESVAHRADKKYYTKKFYICVPKFPGTDK